MGSFNIGNLFSSFSGGGGGSILSSDLISQYNSIKNGSYFKLAKAYYAKQKPEKSTAKSTTKDKTETDEVTKKNSLMSKESAALSKSVDTLNDDSLWEKKKTVTKNEETGEETETEDYDWNAITSAMKSFVDNYNKVIDSAGNSSSKDVIYSGTWMTGTTIQNQKALEKIGITVGKDNKLTLDEEKLKQSDVSSIKRLFKGQNSYASKVAAKAATITRATAGTGSSYTSMGKYTTDYVSALTGGTYNKNV